MTKDVNESKSIDLPDNSIAVVVAQGEGTSIDVIVYDNSDPTDPENVFPAVARALATIVVERQDILAQVLDDLTGPQLEPQQIKSVE